jgi:hypothetical protein
MIVYIITMFTHQYLQGCGTGMCVKTVWNLRHLFSSFISDKDETVHVRSNTPHYGMKHTLLGSISLLTLLSEVILHHHPQLKLPMLPEAQHCEISYYLWDLCLLPWLSSILALALCSTYHSHSNHLVRSAAHHLCVIQSESNKLRHNKNVYLHLQ